MPGLRLGTRGSKLAMWQAEWVRDALINATPGLSIEIVAVRTSGDRDQKTALHDFGGAGVFVKELETALLAGEIDAAVHSLKDLPTQQPPELSIAAVSTRWDYRDALITFDGRPLADLPRAARVGTGSLRRQAQLRALRPDLDIVTIRGNIETRMARADGADLHAVVLACAGLDRLDMRDRIAERLGAPTFLPAPGQGVLAIEVRASDHGATETVALINDVTTAACTTAERALMARLEAGCHAPVAGLGTIDADGLTLQAFVGDPGGMIKFRDRETTPLTPDFNTWREAAAKAGTDLAERLLSVGAAVALRAP